MAVSAFSPNGGSVYRRGDDAWLSDVTAIISESELNLYNSLSAPEDRARFERAFWKLRDPSPTIPFNEYQAEHYRRLRYADTVFVYGDLRGRETDRGKVYIILGDPLERLVFESSSLIAPVHAWRYSPQTGLGIKYHFYVVFFQPARGGDYLIYSPSRNGPSSLLSRRSAARGGEPAELAALSTLAEVDPLLAQLSLSLIPQEHRPIIMGNPAELRRSLSRRTKAGDQLISAVLESRNRRPGDAVADLRKLMRRVGETEDKIAGEGSFTKVQHSFPHEFHLLLADPRGLSLFFNCALDPGRLATSQYQGRSFALLLLHARAFDKEGKLVLEDEKVLTAAYNSYEIESGTASPLCCEARLDLPSGEFDVSIQLKNPFDRSAYEFEERVEIVRTLGGTIRFCSPVFLAETREMGRDEPEREGPYRFYGFHYVPDATGITAPGKDTAIYYQLFFPRRDRLSSVLVRSEVLQGDRALWSEEVTLYYETMRPGGIFSRTAELPTGALPAGEYTFRITAKTLSPPEARAELDFVIAPSRRKGAVVKTAEIMP